MIESNKYIIYRIKNIITGKSYIGKHTTTNEFDSYFGSGIALKAAIKKYGKDKFIKEILEFCEDDLTLSGREIFWISEFNSFVPYGYNISIGGKGGDNFTNNPNKEEIRKRMIDNRKPRIVTLDEREAMRVRMTGSKLKPHEKIECEYCKLIISRANHNRWHGNHCKNNPNSITKEQKNKICKHCGIEVNTTENLANHVKYCISNPNRRSNNKIKKECVHCGKKVTESKYSIYHGDNCKKNPIFIKNPEIYKKTKAYDIITRMSDKIRKLPKSIETIDKMKISNKKKWERLKENPTLYVCEYCKKSVSLKTNYIRWHGNNCKHIK